MKTMNKFPICLLYFFNIKFKQHWILREILSSILYCLDTNKKSHYYQQHSLYFNNINSKHLEFGISGLKRLIAPMPM